MCLTFAGRLQTRLVTLIGPLLLVSIYIGVSRDPVYLTMFALMAALGIALDVAVYHWLIGYQARWLTILLGAFEFTVLGSLAAPPADLARMAGFYVPAWVLVWLTLEVALPLAWPRWAEDGGEFRMTRATAVVHSDLHERRNAFGTTAVLMLVGALPWIIGAVLRPPEIRFTGVLFWPEAHLQAMQHTLVTLHSRVVTTPVVLAQGSLLVHVLWLCATAGWLLGLRTRAGTDRVLSWLIVALLPPLIMPLPFLATLAAAVWLLPMLPWRWLTHAMIPWLAAIVLLVAFIARAQAGALTLQGVLQAGVIIVWLPVLKTRALTEPGLLWLAVALGMVLLLPLPLIVLLVLLAWSFVPGAWHWLVGAIIPALTLVLLVSEAPAGKGGWDALWLYYALWAVAVFVWLLSVRMRAGANRPLIYAAALLPAMLLPAWGIAALTAIVFAMPTLSPRWTRAAVYALAVATLLVWGMAWAQMGATRQSAMLPAYIDTDRWEVAAWLRRSNPIGPLSISDSQADQLVRTLSGFPTTSMPAAAPIELLIGPPCGIPGTQFLSGEACVLQR